MCLCLKRKLRIPANNDESETEPPLKQERKENKEILVIFQEGELANIRVDGVIVMNAQPFGNNIVGTIVQSRDHYSLFTPKPGQMQCKKVFHLPAMKRQDGTTFIPRRDHVKDSLEYLFDRTRGHKCTTVAMDTISILKPKDAAAMVKEVILEMKSLTDSTLDKLYIVDNESKLKSFKEAFWAYKSAGRHVKKAHGK